MIFQDLMAYGNDFMAYLPANNTYYVDKQLADIFLVVK